MKANEFRIGNYANFRGKVIKINYLTEQFIGFDWDEHDQHNENPSPIPLTEEWLLKFGSINPYNDSRRQIGLFIFCWEIDVLWLYNEESLDSMFGTKPLKYVHQLQNLYFALTGEELTK